MFEEAKLSMIMKAAETLPAKLKREFAERLTKQAYGVERKRKKKASERVTKESLDLILKGFLSGTAESGTHFHVLIRNQLKTLVDGVHKHAFLFTTFDGEMMLLFSEQDGEHWHTQDEANGRDVNAEVSSHKHVIRIPFDIVHQSGIELKKGTVLVTDLAGEHPHGADMLETTNFDGAHPHTLDIGVDMNGQRVSIDSIDITEFWDLFGPFDLSDIEMGRSSIEMSRDQEMMLLPIRKESMFTGHILKEADASEMTESMAIAAAAFNMPAITEEEVICKQADVIELLFDKKSFPTQTEVKQKATALNHPDLLLITEEKDRFRARVAKPSDFETETKNVRLETGVFAVVGTRKKKVQKAGHMMSEEFDKVVKQSEVQSLIFPKDKFTKKQARDFIKRNKRFRSGKIDETSTSFRFRQSDPDKFERFRTITLQGSGGVKATLGILKEHADWMNPDDLDHSDLDLEELRMERSEVFDIPITKESAVMGEMSNYGDPVNFKFRMVDADSVMKSIEAFSEESEELYSGDKLAKTTVYERLVTKAFELGVEVKDETDRLLSNIIFKEAEEIKKKNEVTPPWFNKDLSDNEKEHIEKTLGQYPLIL